MKRNIVLFCAIGAIIAGVVLFGWRGYDNQKAGPPATSTAPGPPAALPTPETGSEISPYCDLDPVVRAGFKELCQKIRPDVVNYLKDNALLMTTLTNIASRGQDKEAAALEILNNPPAAKKGLAQRDTDGIAAKILEKMAAAPPNVTLSQPEVDKITSGTRNDLSQVRSIILITLVLLVALGIGGWFYARKPFGYISKVFGPRRFGEIQTESGSGWQIRMENSLSKVTEKTEKNAMALAELKDLLLDFMAEQEEESVTVPAIPAGVPEEQSPVTPPRRQVTSLVEPEFALPVSKYKNSISSAEILKRNRYGSGLEKSADGNGEFLLIKVQGSRFIVIPFFEFFDKPELFSTYYQNFYERTSDQSIGRVYIKRAALVCKVDDMWELQQKGLLEIQ